MDAYEIYNTFLLLKAHFKRWDFDYREKRSLRFISPEVFAERRTEIHFCNRIARKLHPFNHVLYAITDNPTVWLREIAKDDESYFRHRRVIEALRYHFTQEVEMLCDAEEHPFINPVAMHPRAARLYFGGKVSLETLAIINEMTNYADHWCTKDRMLSDAARLITKYMTFLPSYDRSAFLDIVATGMIKRQKEYNLAKI